MVIISRYAGEKKEFVNIKMRYKNTVKGKFIDRPNRFVAHVEVSGRVETVHVKNTGRCRELLLPGTEVVLEVSDNPNRKTKFDLVCVWKENLGWVNIDSQAPNKIAGEWLSTLGFDYIKPEYRYGNSRIDFYMERGSERFLYEVKGCTLEIDRVGYFPDAPTERGVKHIRELIKAKKEGFSAGIVFVIPMEGVFKVLPNRNTHPEFGFALDEAGSNGVEIIFLPCRVTENEVFFITE